MGYKKIQQVNRRGINVRIDRLQVEQVNRMIGRYKQQTGRRDR